MELKLTFHTSEPRLQEMCRAYWGFAEEDGRVNFTQSASEIARAYNEAVHRLAARVGELCEAHVEGYTCVSCDAPRVFKNRSAMHQYWKHLDEEWTCPTCLQAEHERLAEQRRQLENRRRLIVESTYADNLERRNVFIDELSLDTAVYLLSLIRLTATEDFGYLRPLATVSSELPLAPTSEYSAEILNQLFQEGAIAIHPDTDLNAFIWEGDEMPRFYPMRTTWALPCHPYEGGPSEFAAALERSLSDSEWWPNPDWQNEQVDLRRRIALEECLQYLDVQMKEHGFDFAPGEKTRLTLTNVLVNFSVSQVYNMIWKGARDAAAFYVRERVSKQHAANVVVGSIQRYADRALAEGWEVSKYRRDRHVPVSMLSQVTFNTVLQIGEDGFNEPPARSS